MLLGMKYRS